MTAKTKKVEVKEEVVKETPVKEVVKEVPVQETVTISIEEFNEMKQALKLLTELAKSPEPTEKPPRETIEVIRNKKSPLVVKQHPKWPAMFFIKRENGGRIPPDLGGLFTSIGLAEMEIAKHLG